MLNFACAWARLDALPEELCRLSRLHTLDISFNALAAVPDAIGELKSLRSLLLQQNSLESLPAALSLCAKLELLDAAANNLSALPASMGSLQRLSTLLLDGNRHDPTNWGKKERSSCPCFQHHWTDNRAAHDGSWF